MLASDLLGRDLIAFCDNSAAVATLVRGLSNSEDANGMAEATHLFCLEEAIRIWIDWVDSKSNPADGLSRDGLQDSWTMAQGWICRQLRAQAPELTGTPFDAVAALRHWALLESAAP